MEPLYSITETAIKLGGISKKTVEMWLHLGKLRRTKVGRRTMISESELLRVMEVGGVSAVSGGAGRKPKKTAEQVA